MDGLARLSLRTATFKMLAKKIADLSSEFQAWLQHGTPEMCVPILWETDKPLSPISQAMMKLLLIQAVRPDRVMAAGHQMVDSVLGKHYLFI